MGAREGNSTLNSKMRITLEPSTLTNPQTTLNEGSTLNPHRPYIEGRGEGAVRVGVPQNVLQHRAKSQCGAVSNGSMETTPAPAESGNPHHGTIEAHGKNADLNPSALGVTLAVNETGSR